MRVYFCDFEGCDAKAESRKPKDWRNFEGQHRCPSHLPVRYSPSNSRKSKRDAEIVEAFGHLESCQAVASIFGVSSQRIQQIISRTEIVAQVQQRRLNRKADAARLKAEKKAEKKAERSLENRVKNLALSLGYVPTTTYIQQHCPNFGSRVSASMLRKIAQDTGLQIRYDGVKGAKIGEAFARRHSC